MMRLHSNLVPIALLVLVASYGMLRGDEAGDLDKVSVQISAKMKAGHSHAVYYTDLSRAVGVEADVLRADHAKYRLGYGDFYIAHLIAHESGQPIEVIVTHWRAKQGWGAIAKAHGIKLGPVVRAARQSSQARAQSGSGKMEPDAKGNSARTDPKNNSGQSNAGAPKSAMDRGNKGRSKGAGKK